MSAPLHRTAPVDRRESVTGTNAVIKSLAAERELAEGYTLVAYHQTQGRGRLGRSFASPKGGVYLSMLLYPGENLSRTATLTPCAAVAVCRALERVCGVTPGIKWPNDLLLDGRKLCGILTESFTARARQAVVLGIGINVNTPASAFDDEVKSIAVSLAEYTLAPLDRAAVADAVIAELDQMYAVWQTDTRAALDDYRRLCVSTDRPVNLILNGQSRPAYALGIDENYALQAQINGQIENITMGEVSLSETDIPGFNSIKE